VAAFGFGYDEEFLRVLDEPWPGVRAAEQDLAREAASRGTTVDRVRRERQDLYDRWLAEQVRDDEAERAGATTAARSGRTTTSGG